MLGLNIRLKLPSWPFHKAPHGEESQSYSASHLTSHAPSTAFRGFTRKPRGVVKHAAKQVTNRVTRLSTGIIRLAIPQSVSQRIRTSFSHIGESLFNIAQSMNDKISGRYHVPVQRKINVISNHERIPLNKKIPISEFCGLTLNLRSRIDSIQCFQEGRQEFILVLTRGLFLYAHSEQKTWIRLERGLKAAAKSGWAGKWEMIRGKVEAHDTATISLDRKSLIRSHAAPTEILEFERPAIDYGKPVMLKHLMTLLTLIDKVALEYNPLKDNRWVFCQTIVDCMENYQTSRITLRRPNTDLERREVIKAEFIEKIGTQLYNYGPSP